MSFISTYQPLAASLSGADHVDVKSATLQPAAAGLTPDELLRECIVGFFSYQPDWISALYHLRGGLVRLLGMRQAGIPKPPSLAASAIPMEPGAALGFFTVAAAEEGLHWVASASESHLTAQVALVLEAGAGAWRLHAVTVVRYHRWTGPVYFNLIRPFHHLVVAGMLRASAQRVKRLGARSQAGIA